jgi:hypothetical protein
VSGDISAKKKRFQQKRKTDPRNIERDETYETQRKEKRSDRTSKAESTQKGNTKGMKKRKKQRLPPLERSSQVK